MSLADVIIVLIVVVLFALCVRSIIKGQQEGECSDCSAGGSCGAKKHGGHCHESQDLVKAAAAAVDKYEAKRATEAK